MNAAGVERQLVTYTPASQWFFDDTRPDHATRSTDPWRRILEFLAPMTPNGVAR
jgi:hypothetical protein